MTPALYAGWSAILAAGSEQVGGKAWTLARLARHGFPIPDGIGIGVAAYKDWLSVSGLEDDLVAASLLTTAERTERLRRLVEALREVQPPSALLVELSRLLATPGWAGRALAVRSSAPQEDSAKASFAGIHSSCLNVGPDTLGAALVDVWSSLWTPAAVAYRERQGIDHREAAMAILVMPLIPARAAGIGFTCDPASGRDDRLVIHANWGLGESLVSGQANGDEIILAENLLDDRLTVLEYRTGTKATITGPAPLGGTERSATPPARAAERVLNPGQALDLGELLRLAALALDFTKPEFDCEWAWDGECFWLLQARPITARQRCTYPFLLAQPQIWSRGNTKDVVPDPLSPIDWGSSRRLVNCLLEQGYRLCDFPIQPGVQRAGLFHGRLYLNLSLIQWEGYAAFAVEPAAMNRLVGGHQPEIRTAPLSWRQRLNRLRGMVRFLRRAAALRKNGQRDIAAAHATAVRWRSRPLPGDNTGYAETIREITRHVRSASVLHFFQGSGGASLSLLVDMIEACLPGEGHALASALMAGGEPSVTARLGYDLVALAKGAMADPVTGPWLLRRTREDDRWDNLPENNPFRREFADFLERYGHRGVYESYTRNPRWREAPGYLLDSLPDLAATDLEALAARQRQSVARAMQRTRAHLPWWKLGMFKMLLASAKVETNGREAARSALMSLLEPGRRLLLDLGGWWTEQGYLEAAEDIFLLIPVEILAVLEGRHPPISLRPLAEERRAQFARWQLEEAPDFILSGEGNLPPAQDEASPPITSGDCFRGVAVGSGIATGAARLLRTPEEGYRLAHGDILVVPSTDPAWTPLFLKAGGLVMETGGFLSHGAIVAREFGIPAVVNLPGILHRLRDGEPLRVDGLRGEVHRLERNS